jgi:hypothetical protein
MPLFDLKLKKKLAPLSLLRKDLAKKIVSAQVFKRIYQPVVLDFNFEEQVSRPIPVPSRIRELVVFTLIAITILFTFQSAKIIASGISTKATVLGTTTLALSHLKDAQGLVTQKDFLGADQQFQFAQQNFKDAQKNISNLGGLVSAALKLTPQGQDADNLLKAGQQLSEAGIDLDNFYLLISEIKITPAGFNTPDGFYGTVNASKKYLNLANSNLILANQNLSVVKSQDLPEKFRDQFVKYKDQLDFVTKASGQLTELLSLFQELMGPSPKSFLVLFENNNELRPSGGFIGTYGYFKTNDGKIISQKISSIYDLDGQLTEKIAAPGAFHDATPTWGIRDSNWFSDFRTSAVKAGTFFEKEAGETPDAVIAVTPDVFVDLLKITGPIDFPKYNLTLTADNFREQVQLNTSVLYDKKSNAPKQMLADFAPLLIQKLSEIKDGSKTALLSLMFKNLSSKNILFFDRNPAVQSELEKYNWAGAINANDSDYLSIVNTNIGGRKTDLDVKQSALIKSEVQSNGEIINTLTYTREHQINLNQTDKNIDYVRFLVPQGSKLISAEGFNFKKHYLSDGSGNSVGANYIVDPDLAAIDKSSQIDPTSGTVTTVESGKTSFGNWIEIDPGQKSSVTIKYILPFNYSSVKHFSILLQKQPGNNPINISYQLSQPKAILWYTPSGLDVNNRVVNFNQDLLQDAFFGVVLKDQQK